MATISEFRQPINAGNIANAGYTVPAGRYARVMASLMALTRITGISAGNTSLPKIYETNSMSANAEYYLRSGEVITISNSTPSGSITSGVDKDGDLTASTAMSIGGTVVCQAQASLTIIGDGDNASYSSIAHCNYRYEEFYNIY